MESTPKLTFIIPVYNVEQYVERCLNSILSQQVNAQEYHIVVLDDGSTDKSLSIACSVLAGRSNCEVYSTMNRGVGAARNAALKHAKGKYIWFVDSDDFIEANCLKQIISTLHKGEADVFNFGYTSNITGIRKKYYVPTINKHLCVGPWAHLFKREFLLSKNLLFKEGILHEDFEFIPRALFLAAKVENLDLCPYGVHKRPGSITTTMNPQKSFDLITVAQSLYEFQNEHKSENCDMNQLISLALNNSLQNTLDDRFGSENESLLTSTFKSHKYLFRSLWRSGICKYQIEYILFSLLPSHIVRTFKILKKLQGGQLYIQSYDE